MDTQRVRFYSTCFHKNGATIGGAHRYPGLTNLRAKGTIEKTTSVPAGHPDYKPFSCLVVPTGMTTNLKIEISGNSR